VYRDREGAQRFPALLFHFTATGWLIFSAGAEATVSLHQIRLAGRRIQAPSRSVKGIGSDKKLLLSRPTYRSCSLQRWERVARLAFSSRDSRGCPKMAPDLPRSSSPCRPGRCAKEGTRPGFHGKPFSLTGRT